MADHDSAELDSRISKAGPLGRSLRLVLGVGVMIIALPVYFKAGLAYDRRSLGVVLGLTVFYTLVHYVIARFAPNFNRSLGAVLAVMPVFLVWFFGQGGGPIFGQGEGGTGAITYIGVSLLIDAARADSGCEVMAIPGLILRNRTHLACIALSPLDLLERKLNRG